jgi:hypothetical protein
MDISYIQITITERLLNIECTWSNDPNQSQNPTCNFVTLFTNAVNTKVIGPQDLIITTRMNYHMPLLREKRIISPYNPSQSVEVCNSPLQDAE